MFNKLEKEGDNAVSLADYLGGIAKYDEALLIFADNQRVIDKKNNANDLLAEANSKKDLDDQYNELIVAADSDFINGDYSAARGIYQRALNIKPEEQYPKNRISEIDQLLLDLEDKKVENEKSALFAQLESEGDEQVDASSYTEAIKKYDSALELYPEDARVQQKAGQARQLLKTAKSAKELEEMYTGFIAEADAQFTSEVYHDARVNYQQAFALMPKEYPKEQIGKIDKILLDIEKQLIQEEAARLAQMNKKDEELSWNETISDEEKYIRDAKNLKDENENIKYEELLAYKKSLDNTEQDYRETGDNNRSSNASVINEEKKVKGLLYDNTKIEDDQRHIAEVEMVREMDKRWNREMNAAQRERAKRTNQTEEYARYRKQLEDKHREVIMRNYDNSKKTKEVRYKTFGEKENLRQKNMDEISNAKKGLKSFYTDNKSKQQSHIQSEYENTQSIKNTIGKDFVVGTELAATNYKNLKSENELRDMETKAWKEKSDLKRSVEIDDVNSMKWSDEKTPYDYYPKEKAKTYQQGVTEEVYDEGNNKVVRRVVVQGNRVDEYKMVVTNHGTYYFKNKDSITKNTWNLNTENVNVTD